MHIHAATQAGTLGRQRTLERRAPHVCCVFVSLLPSANAIHPAPSSCLLLSTALFMPSSFLHSWNTIRPAPASSFLLLPAALSTPCAFLHSASTIRPAPSSFLLLDAALFEAFVAASLSAISMFWYVDIDVDIDVVSWKIVRMRRKINA